MNKTDPDATEEPLYVCQDCGTGVENAEHGSKCPECGGPLRNTTVAHD